MAELVAADRMKPAFLFERCADELARDAPHPESVRNLNAPADYEAALARAAARRPRALLRPAAAAGRRVRAATLGAAAAAVGVTLDEHVLAALNGDQVARDPAEPLAEGDSVAFMAADAGG